MPRPTDGRETRVCVAQIGAAHGLRGGVHLRSFTEAPDAFAQYGPLETEDRSRRLEIDSVKPSKDGFTVRFVGITRREQAEALRNIHLYVDRDRLPAPDDGEFYFADLIGLAAVTPQGEPFGEVIAVHNFGAGDIIELKLCADGTSTMLLFDTATVPEVDIAGGRIVVVMPEEIVVQDDPASSRPNAATPRASRDP
ncbi:MAG: ribosome maturation factor RimM [Pseudorhodoplanes sp.]|uniref:ribosome maturation factor RimM n=1 Tax=Pseudorhodoplanes sp. TaxID=1934341 RepID=UPI003D13A8AA